MYYTMRTISMKIPDQLDARLERMAEERGTSKSDLVRRALEAHLERLEAPDPGSVGRLAADLAGCVEGPADLSTSQRHFEDFGR
jgi:predicted transcriptional regulator